MRLTQAFNLPFSQAEVDFVIPDLVTDLPLSIDPFLLYKSRDDVLQDLHVKLLSIFAEGFRCFRAGQEAELDRLIDFPEVDELGLGYSIQKIKGRGLGWLLNNLLKQTLIASPALLERGLHHIEELQLVSIGVGPDRVSDIASNVLKAFLVEYTQQQATLWNIPIVSGLPVQHIFDFDDWSWTDGYFDLPQNPVSGLPIILVPRRIVRELPWINYEDYVRTDFSYFLRPRQVTESGRQRGKKKRPAKRAVTQVTRTTMTLLDNYIERKVREAEKAVPTLGLLPLVSETQVALGQEFADRLYAIPSGWDSAAEYQRLVYEILNYLFEPELTAGAMEARTHLGTDRRDIIYVNESERAFLRYVRETYQTMSVVFETKNVQDLEPEHVNQVAAYLGARLGMLGFIVCRRPAKENVIRKAFTTFNDTRGDIRKTILIASDDDLIEMISLKKSGKNPADRLRDIYRDFHWAIQ